MKFSINMSIGSGETEEWIDIIKRKIQIIVLNQQIMKAAIFAGGCFWCMEPPFRQMDGVIEVVSTTPEVL